MPTGPTRLVTGVSVVKRPARVVVMSCALCQFSDRLMRIAVQRLGSTRRVSYDAIERPTTPIFPLRSGTTVTSIGVPARSMWNTSGVFALF